MMDDGMSYVHISVDLQFYMVASQIKWNDIDRFKNVILRPGIMHIQCSPSVAASANTYAGRVLSLLSAQRLEG